ncbi:MAG: hypothetical protein AVDCRST_MAG56-266 [uncultured Cytophagales bacterium]|uniref:Uncharacterized protein n=1 Tax=uncultured Cytophagales bacterium TaxID=158755 RepID=A0A6J4HC03_9SPHI|nr:MAG: hypothetical protein AVDCRST_MAG56-266 [uncultured Cytophagales bacterium]
MLAVCASCQRHPKQPGAFAYAMRDYLEVGAYFNRADRETPNSYPYIIQLSRGNKRLTFIGTRHTHVNQ